MSTKRIAYELLGRLIPKQIEFLSTEFKVVIKGPSGSPHRGGCFVLGVKCLQDYPNNPPIIRFRTKIYHLNVDQDGNIGLKLLNKERWTRKHLLCTALQHVEQLLKIPNIDDALEQDIADVFKSDKSAFLKRQGPGHCNMLVETNKRTMTHRDDEDAQKDKIDGKKYEKHVEEQLNKVEKFIETLSLSNKKKAPSTLSTQELQRKIQVRNFTFRSFSPTVAVFRSKLQLFYILRLKIR